MNEDQPTYEELKNLLQKEQNFRQIREKLWQVSTARLPFQEKAILQEVLQALMFRVTYQGYSKIVFNDVAYALGMGRRRMDKIKLRIKKSIEKLVKDGLLLQRAGKYPDDETLLCIPDNILSLLKGFSRRASRDYTYSLTCKRCGYNGAPRYHLHTTITAHCGNCDASLEEKESDKVIYMGEIESESETEYHDLQGDIIPSPTIIHHHNSPHETWQTEQPYPPELVDQSALAVVDNDGEFDEILQVLATLPDAPVDSYAAKSDGKSAREKAIECIEQAEMNGYRIGKSNADARLILVAPAWIDNEQWQKAREAMRPYDAEILQVLEERQQDEQSTQTRLF